MLFHVVGIKETTAKKYNMDILINGESDKFVRDLLQSHNIIVLNFSEYKKTADTFGQLFFVTNFKNVDIQITTYLTDVESALFNFLMIGFDIKDINFNNENKLPENQTKELIQKISKKVKDIQNKEEDDVKQQKEQERKIYKDDKLEKILQIVEKTFVQIDSLLEKVGTNASQDKIRDLNMMKQELTKLKMGRNDDKMSELLEKIYDKSDEIENEYLNYLKQHIDYPIPGSVVSNIDVISENQKLKKAKKIKQIGAKRDADDNYYLSFESTGLHLKFFWKDFTNRLRDLSGFLFSIFDYLEFAAILIIAITAFILWFKKATYITDENLYNYVFLLKTSIFGVFLYYAKKLRKTKTYSNIMLLFFTVLISIGLFWFLKINLSF